MSSDVLEIIANCNYCKREIEDGMIYQQHPKFGIVCERCEPFGEGYITVIDEKEDE